MSPVTTATAPLADLVEECLDEATFLWHRWEAELTSPTRSLDEVWSWTEDRLHGALDGVRIGRARMIEIATKGLVSDEIDRVAASAAVLGSRGRQRATSAIVAALDAAEGERLGAMARGLELLGSDQALRAAARVLTAGGPDHAGALCRLKAFRRVAAGDELMTAWKSDVPRIQTEAVRAALQVSSRHGEDCIADALRSSDAAVRLAAVESGLPRRMQQAWDVTTRMAQQRTADAGPYLRLIGLLGTAEEHAIVYEALRIPAVQTHAVWALGHIGTARAAESCLAGMQYEKLARACGEAYCWITGADLARDRLEADETPPEVPKFEEDDLDANLVPPPEALWPLPHPDAVRAHWLGRRSGLAADIRYVRGRPASTDTLMETVEHGPMLRRPDLLLELRAKTRGTYDVEPRAFVGRQRQMMAAGRAALAHRDGN